MSTPHYLIDWDSIDEMLDDTPSCFDTYTEWVRELEDSCYALPEFTDLPLLKGDTPIGE